MTVWKLAAVAWANEQLPREACGLVVVVRGKEQFVPCANAAAGNDHFIISAEDYAAAEDAGEIVGVFHSHPYALASPSEADLVSCERSGLPWHIVSLPDEQWYSWEPTGYSAPLVGRQFQHGVLDCWAVVRDWYRIERGLDFPDFERHDNWWHDGGNLYVDNFAAIGFRVVDEPEIGDMLFMQIGSSVPNHAAVYLGDGMILHHLQGRLSSRDVYGGYFQKVTTHILRHEGNSTLR